MCDVPIKGSFFNFINMESILTAFSFSFVLIQKKRKQKEKIKATSPGLLRKGRSGTEKRTRFAQTAFFSTARPFLRSRPYA